MKKFVLFIAVIALLTGTQSCFDPYNGGLCISGVGPIVTEEVTLDAFKSVEVETVVDVDIIQGTEQKVVVEGHENMIEEISLTVVNGRLKIDLKNNCYSKFDLKVFITIPELVSVENGCTGDITLGGFTNLKTLDVEVSSTGDIIGDGSIEVDDLVYINNTSTGNISLDITTNEVKAYITSTGNIELTGSCYKQVIELDGTGDYRAYDFESEICEIESDGIGDAKVYVTEELDAYINSVGNVYVKGDPKIHSIENSVGDLISVD